jgi:hypothetical protein
MNDYQASPEEISVRLLVFLLNLTISCSFLKSQTLTFAAQKK